jgi:hypothetical protein
MIFCHLHKISDRLGQNMTSRHFPPLVFPSGTIRAIPLSPAKKKAARNAPPKNLPNTLGGLNPAVV